MKALPAELRHPESDVNYRHVQEGDDVVVARVDLGEGTTAATTTNSTAATPSLSASSLRCAGYWSAPDGWSTSPPTGFRQR
ncbi:hypothetical protein [Streptosporangium sp. NPDC002607]